VNAAAAEKPSDLSIRLLSAIAMIVVAGSAMRVGGLWFDAFVSGVALVTFGEFWRLIVKATTRLLVRIVALLAGACYIGMAALMLIRIDALEILVFIVGVVVLIDTFAYFFGRTIGGPKIAPAISPSKTWAGFAGGAFGAMVAICLYFVVGTLGQPRSPQFFLSDWPMIAGAGILLTFFAQSGDFFESWLKRRAGVKDSSSLIPGHGGVFDRVDGLLPVAIFVGAITLTVYPHWAAR
jgi:phosphatidate cytidylyltransferase